MYALPQEIEVWYLIPAIRRELARLLTRKHGLSYEKAGEILGVSKAAVSQYLSRKRARGIKFPDKIKQEIEKSAIRIARNEKLAVKEMLRLLGLMKKSGFSCEICKKYNEGIIKKCGMRPIY